MRVVKAFESTRHSVREDDHMEHLLNKLIGLLTHATELYQALLGVVQNEKEAVVGLNLKQLNEACKAKDNLLLKLRILEEQRQQVMDRVADELGCSAQRLTLTRLSQQVAPSYARRLLDRSTDLLALIQILQEVTQQNKSLMTHSMQLIQGSYNLLNNLMVTHPVYFRSGTMDGGEQTGRLLNGDI
ncbi:MAG: flagellar protein FlgN [Desulfobacterales bacterium]|nr:flagellar protein FlgN [Desulfobacterales bacterium]